VTSLITLLIPSRASPRPESNAFYFFGDASTYVEGASKTMEGSSKPFGYFDPFNLGDVDSVTLAWCVIRVRACDASLFDCTTRTACQCVCAWRLRTANRAEM